MIDWFVLLITPFIVLAIVMLLVFVGCNLDRMGEATPFLGFYIGEGSFEEIAGMNVQLSVNLEDGTSRGVTHGLGKEDLVKGTHLTFVRENGYSKDDVVSASCICFILPYPGTDVATQHGDYFVVADRESQSDNWSLSGAPDFSLTRVLTVPG